METTLEVGAVVDIATGKDAEDIRHGIDGLHGLMSRAPVNPIYQTFTDTVASVGSAPTVLNLEGPASGRVWDIRQLVSLGSDDRSGTFAASVSGVAAAGGSLTLPIGAVLTSVTITSATAAAPVTGVVTVAGATTQSYQYTFDASEDSTSYAYSPGVQPAAGGAVVVTMPAVVGGSAWSIDATYECPVAWYIGTGENVMLGMVIVPATDTLPYAKVPASSESIFLHYGEKLIMIAYGVPSGQQVTGICRIADWPSAAVEGARIGGRRG